MDSAFKLRLPSRWTLAAILVALIIATPIITILGFVFFPSTDTWAHLVDTVLADYVSNSLLLMLGVAVGAGSMGITMAWLTSMCRFPGRRIFTWALLLPLAAAQAIIIRHDKADSRYQVETRSYPQVFFLLR